MTYIELLAEIDKQKRLQGVTNPDLARTTGFALSTITGFMGGKRYSDLVAKKICTVLGIQQIEMTGYFAERLNSERR